MLKVVLPCCMKAYPSTHTVVNTIHHHDLKLESPLTSMCHGQVLFMLVVVFGFLLLAPGGFSCRLFGSWS